MRGSVLSWIHTIMKLDITTPPSTLAVTVASCNLHGRMNTGDDDALVADWIKSAADLWERGTGKTLVATTYRLELDSVTPTIRLPRSPITSVTSVEYLNTAGTWTAFTDYTRQGDRLFLTTTPTIHATMKPSLRVTFTAGPWSSSSAQQAVRLLVQHWWEHREAFTADNLKELPLGWGGLTRIYRGAL